MTCELKTDADYSVIEKLMNFFMEADTNKDGSLSKNELISIARKHNVDTREVDAFIERFDTDKDGNISLEEYAKGLGLNVDEVSKEMKIRLKDKSSPPKCSVEGVTILHSTMAQSSQKEVIEKFKELIDKNGDTDEKMDTVIDELKNYLDKEFGRIWQVVILSGSFWVKFTHEPFSSIQFQYGEKRIVLAWRTHRQ
ncbi:unnamed protein product [Calicophoron daubneyi]|uniref:EF-hand domain-containing protein n=1 Tax=Calicophoron daubneyi TaxID=300641 RepID=A0AAV2T846_CALDB